MATNNQEILRVSFKDYKKAINELKDELLGLEKGTEQYEQTLQQVRKYQSALNQVNQDTKKNIDALDGSYDALVRDMAALKKEWRATNDEAKRNELGAQITDINNQLKNLDYSLGNFQRNVGNYEGATVSLKAQLKELNDTMVNMLANGVKQTDPAFVELAQKAGAIKDAIMDAKAATKEYADDVRGMTIGVDVAKNLTAAYGAATSAMTLFGIETDDAQKVMAKMTTIMTLLNSLQTINKAINDSASPTRKLLITLFGSHNKQLQQNTVLTAENTIAEQASTAARNTTTAAIGSETVAQTVNKDATIANTAAIEAQTVATKGATLATKAFKKALIATGIGAIIVGIGELIAHFEDLEKWLMKNAELLQKMGPMFSTLGTTLALANEQAKEGAKDNELYSKSLETFTKYSDTVSNSAAKLTAKFNKLRAEFTALKTKAQQTEWLKKNKEEIGKIASGVDNVNKANALFVKHSDLVIKSFMARARAAASEALEVEALGYKYKALLLWFKDQNSAMDYAIKYRNAHNLALREQNAALAQQATLTDKLNKLGITLNDGTTANGGKSGNVNKNNAVDDTDKKSKESLATIKEYINAQYSIKTAQERINNEKEEALLFERDELKQAEIRQKYLEKEAFVISKVLEGLDEVWLWSHNNLFSDFKFDNSDNLWSNLTDKDRDDLSNFVNDKIQQLQKEYGKINLSLKKLGVDIPELTIKKTVKEATDEISQLTEDLSIELEKIQNKYDKLNIGADQKTVDLNKQKEQREVLEATFESQRKQIEIQQALVDGLSQTDEEYLKQVNILEHLKNAYEKTSIAIQGMSAANTKTKMSFEKSVQIYGQWANGVSNILSSVTSAQQQQLQSELNQGKISEEAAEKRFEELKQYQIAATVIQTLAGATAAVMSVWKDPTIPTVTLKSITAGIIGAATLASGYAQVAQIRAQTLGGSGGGLSGNTINGIAMQPLLNERLDSDSLQNIQIGRLGERSDNRVYILESDLQKSDKRVEIRQSATSF